MRLRRSTRAGLTDSGKETTGERPSAPAGRHIPWTPARRLLASLPIFIILMGVLSTVSHATQVPWDNDPINQTMATATSDTAVITEPAAGTPAEGLAGDELRDWLDANTADGNTVPGIGTYEVDRIDDTIDLERPSTGETQHAHIIVRHPTNAAALAKTRQGGKGLPGVVFMHGAGYGTADNSFGDVATDLASAGFVTIVVDKPAWSTGDIDRDYPASAHAYDQCVDYLRGLDFVDDDGIGMYATSESTWITPWLIRQDGRIAFQILASPMVFTPRHALGFFVAQDFAIVGANPGYQSIVRRVFSADATLFGLTNLDFASQIPEAYSIPTFVAYGSKDVMTAQVQGARTILASAKAAGNQNVTIRNYPIANHVLRLGDESETGTMLVDHYEDDMAEWASGIASGRAQLTPRIAGATIHQSIAVPDTLRAERPLTVYGLIVHVAMVAMLLVAIVTGLVVWAKVAARRIRYGRAPRGRAHGPRPRPHRLFHGLITLRRRRPKPADPRPAVLGFSHDFGNVLTTITVTSLVALALFLSGLAQTVMRVVSLIWGAAPVEPGMIAWSWYVIQIACAVVVWAWSRVFAGLIEAGVARGWALPRRERDRLKATGVSFDVPLVASTHLGETVFAILTVMTFTIILMFAFWGLFIY